MLMRMLGLALPPLRLDEVQIVLRSHIFFKMVQTDWIKRISTNHKYLEVTAENHSNMVRGGDCNIFDLIDEVQKAFKHDKEIGDELVRTLKPDILLKTGPERKDAVFKFSILKITNRIAKMGKDVRQIFNLFDIDGDGECKY